MLDHWDQIVDIAIIGSGFAGLSAAIESKKTAESVIVIEKEKACGGNSLISDAGMAAAGTYIQKKEGIKDSPELLAKDMMEAGLGLNDPKLVETLAQKSNETLMWLIHDIKVEIQEKSYLFGGHCVPRTYLPKNISGKSVIYPLKSKAKNMGAEILTETKFSRIINDRDQGVIGIKVTDKKGNLKRIQTKKAAILAAGGFAADINFRKLQDPRLDDKLDHTNCSRATAETIKEAMRIGADTADLDKIQLSPFSSPDEKGHGIAHKFSSYTVFPYGFMVNPEGKRFVNELGDRKVRCDAMLKLGCPAIGIGDLRGTENSGQEIKQEYIKKGVVKRFETLKEIASTYNINYENLQQTFKTYNRFVKQRKDLEFGKPVHKLAVPLSCPFFAIRLWPKVHYVMGGIKIDKDAHVLDKENRRIKGLYAAGEITGGVHGASRLSSCSMTETIVFGRIAGQKAAASKLNPPIF